MENAGKTTLLGALSTGSAPAEALPTIGLNVVTFAKAGKVKFKAWDLGGQTQYRGEWARYAKGCDIIIFVVDVADAARFPQAKQELHRLLEDPELAKTPLVRFFSAPVRAHAPFRADPFVLDDLRQQD